MRKLLTVLLLACSLGALAQNRVGDLYTMDPGNNYPADMPHIRNWMSAALGRAFIANLQSSDSHNGDSKFVSFNLNGPASSRLLFPNAGGLLVKFNAAVPAPRFRSQQLRMEYSQGILYFGRFDINTFHYGLEEYFLLAQRVNHITPDALVANTLNMMVETKKLGDSKIPQLIDDLNRKLKVQLSSPADNSLKGLMPVLKQQFGDQLPDAIFKTYVQSADEAQTNKKLNDFYRIVPMFTNEAVVYRIDRMLFPALKLAVSQEENLEFPLAILSSGSGRAGLDTIRFAFKTLEAQLNYKEKTLVITFAGRLNQKAVIQSGFLMDYQGMGKMKLVKPTGHYALPVDLKELTLTISEKGVQLTARTPEEVPYQLLNNPWPN